MDTLEKQTPLLLPEVRRVSTGQRSRPSFPTTHLGTAGKRARDAARINKPIYVHILKAFKRKILENGIIAIIMSGFHSTYI